MPYDCRTRTLSLDLLVGLSLLGMLCMGCEDKAESDGQHGSVPVGATGIGPHLWLTVTSIREEPEGFVYGLRFEPAGGLPPVRLPLHLPSKVPSDVRLSTKEHKPVLPVVRLALIDYFGPGEFASVDEHGKDVEVRTFCQDFKVVLSLDLRGLADGSGLGDVPDGSVLWYSVATELQCQSDKWVGSQAVQVRGGGRVLLER
jgi:hypothetical protein